MAAALQRRLALADALDSCALFEGAPPSVRGCALRPQRPRRREQKALAEADVIIEQVDHRALALDLLGDQVDAEAAEQVGEVGGMDIGGRLCFGSSSSAAGTLMKRTPRSASSRGSKRKSVTWSIEKR